MSINPTQAAILGLLHDGSMTGGELNSAAQKWLAPYWNTTRSQVYRELPILRDRGLAKDLEAGSRGAQPYKITAAGKREFKRWLKGVPSPDLLRSESMLRIAFGALHDDETLEELLIWMRNHHELKVEEITKLLAEARDAGMEYDQQALRFALMYHQMIIGWLETVELPD